MPLAWLDHVNIRTSKLEDMTRFYADVVGLRAGPRPPFDSTGAWLYCGEMAAVHLLETAETPRCSEPRIEHFAFRAGNMADYVKRLEQHGVEYHTAVVPDLGLIQVHFKDPDGNHIEVAFPPHE